MIVKRQRSLKKLIEDMEKVKKTMATMVEAKSDLCRPEVLKASECLDDLLNEYYRRVLSSSPKRETC